MGQHALSYAPRESLQPDPLVLASHILLHIAGFVMLLLGLFPLFLDGTPNTSRCLTLCVWGAGALAAEWIAIFARSRLATLRVLGLLTFAAYIIYEAVMHEGIGSWSGRLLLVPMALLLTSIAG